MTMSTSGAVDVTSSGDTRFHGARPASGHCREHSRFPDRIRPILGGWSPHWPLEWQGKVLAVTLPGAAAAKPRQMRQAIGREP